MDREGDIALNSYRRRNRRGNGWLSSQLARRPKPVWLIILLHLLALGLALIVFSLFHHVIPRGRTSLGVTSSRNSVQVASTSPIASMDVSAAPTSATGSGSVSTLAIAPTPSPEPAVVGDFSQKFADKFIEGNPVIMENTYVSENLNVTISEYYENGIRYYVADFYIRDISCFRTAFAKDEYGRNITENIRKVAYREESVLTMNGDFYGIREGGVCMRNGELYYTDKVVREICVLYWDGSLQCFPPEEFDSQREMENGAYQIWNFGPAMLDENGMPRPEFDAIYEGIYGNQPRSALGYFEPGHYCFITADGRSDDSRGLTMDQLGAVAMVLGCKQCYNMDGGRTAQLAFGTTIVNNPVTGGRNCSDYLTIVDRIS